MKGLGNMFILFTPHPEKADGVLLLPCRAGGQECGPPNFVNMLTQGK